MLLFALMGGLSSTAQALDGSDWTVTPTRDGVKITCHISGEGTLYGLLEIYRGVILPPLVSSVNIAPDHDSNSQPYRCVVFDRGATVGAPTTYLLLIRSRSDAPGRGRSARKTVTPIALSAPDRPTGFTATAGDGEVTLRWADPSDVSIQSYEYRQKAAGGNYPSNWTAIPNSDDTTTSYRVPNLSNGTAYTFRSGR